MSVTYIQVAPHAIDRAHCGGVPEEGIQLAALYGQPRYYADNRVARTLTGRILRRLVKQRVLTPGKAERLEGTTVLTKDLKHTRLVVTTLPKRPLLGPQRFWLASRRYLGDRNRKRQQVRGEAN